MKLRCHTGSSPSAAARCLRQREVECDHAHPERLVGHCRAFDGEPFHALAGLQLDFPAPRLEVRQFESMVKPRGKQGGDHDELVHLADAVYVAQLDQAAGMASHSALESVVPAGRCGRCQVTRRS